LPVRVLRKDCKRIEKELQENYKRTKMDTVKKSGAGILTSAPQMFFSLAEIFRLWIDYERRKINDHRSSSAYTLYAVHF